MKTNLKKALSIFGVVCFSTTVLFAGTYDQKDNNDMYQSPSKMAVPPGVRTGEDGPGFFITVDYTYWVARQAGLAYAVSNFYDTIENPPTTTPTRGSVFYPNWQARSGFKVGAGVYLGHDSWDLYAEYTWFYNMQQKGKYQGNANFTPGLGVITWPVNSEADPIQQANAFWSNWFNRIDIQLARSFYAGHYLQLRPFIGLLAAWDEQWFNIRYKLDASDLYWNIWTNDQRWWGIGPWTGWETSFLFPSGDNSTQWSLFLDCGMSLPWSESKLSQQQFAPNVDADTVNFSYDHFWDVEPMLEMSLGLRWETWWIQGMNWNFMLQLAWEEQVWFAHNHMSAAGTEAVAGQGNYSMQGLTLKAKIGF